MEQQVEVFYTKWCHGGKKVLVKNSGPEKYYEYFIGSEPKVFKSARSLLIEIHGGRDLHITFDKYFRGKKKYRPGNVLDLFLDSSGKTISRTEICVDLKPSKKLGIDLEKRGHEVAKLFYAGFGSSVINSGYDPEDVLQEIYKGLITRNNGVCPFDPEKGSFGHYVHLVCGCIINNIHRQENKRRNREVVGLPTFVDGSWENADLSANETICAESDVNFQDMRLRKAISKLEKFIEGGELDSQMKEKVKEMIPLLLAGHTQKEIMGILGLSKAGLRKTLSLLRSEAREWQVFS